MRLARQGDDRAYARLLTQLAPFLRQIARQGFARSGLGSEEAEDVVQETLLAIHLKRHTWDDRQPLVPWVRAITANKLIDNLRRRGRRIHVPVDDLADVLGTDEEPSRLNNLATADMVSRLKGRQREVVESIAVEGRSAREVGEKLGMTEGAVRVMLHRALKSLAMAYREGGNAD